MKNKPLRHKEDNTFKFQPFSERIAQVNVDVFHQIKHVNEEQEDDETTHFHQTLEKWTLLNLSKEFGEFKVDVRHSVKTLPQVVKLKDHLVAVIEKYLTTRKSHIVEPILELVVALAQDLRQDFYPYFFQILELLTPLLNTKNADQIEWTFQCLAYLFKFLWRYLISNLPEVFAALFPLFHSTRPAFINNFAAQSFAFVARKVKDVNRLTRLIFKSLQKNSDATDGCGRLVFEIVHGVAGQFHSCSEKVVNSFFSVLDDEAVPHDLVCQVLNSFTHHTLCNIQPNHFDLFWTVLMDKLKFYTEKCRSEKTERNVQSLNFVLSVFPLVIKYKSGAFVKDVTLLADCIIILISPEWDPSTNEKASCLLSTLILSPTLKLTQELCCRIVYSAMTLLREEQLVKFVESAFNYSGFELAILPKFLDFCASNDPLKILHLLARLILKKRPPIGRVDELLSWRAYTLDFGKRRDKAEEYLKSYLDVLSSFEIDDSACLSSIISVLVVLPHILPIQRETTSVKIRCLIETACQKLVKSSNLPHAAATPLLLVISHGIESIILLNTSREAPKLCPPDLIIDALLPWANEKHVYALRALDFYIYVDEVNLAASYRLKIQEALLPNLESPFHKVRLHAVHIFHELATSTERPLQLEVDLLNAAYKAECTEASLTDYREKLKYFQRLSCANESVEAALVGDGGVDGRIFLRFLLGALYENFKLIWDPISTLIVSYANTLDANKFWEVFGSHLESVSNKIRNNDSEILSESPYKNCDYLHDTFLTSNGLNDRPDLINHRILLLSLLQQCVTLCEKKNKDLVTQFFQFLDDEYFKRNADSALTWDVRLENQVDNNNLYVTQSSQLNTTDLDSSAMELDDSKKDEEEQDDNMSVSSDDLKSVLDEPGIELKFKRVSKCLLTYLGIMGKIRCPKNLYREADLYKLYCDFLAHRSTDVQRTALDCLMMYKFKHLVPYRENLFRLIDEKTFKNEVAIFKIDTSSDLIKSEHRPELIPVVLRIAYSKLFSKGLKGQNKQARKATVVRFLAGCSSQELLSFFSMVFSFFHESAMSEDIIGEIDKMSSELDLSAVISPKRLKSSIYLLNTVSVYCGGLMDHDKLTYLLNLYLLFAGHIASIFDRRSQVHLGHIRALRLIRNSLFEGLTKFFDIFDSFPFSSTQIDAIFKVFVWPYLAKLPVEGIHSPTALLRLFISWSKNTRYFPLLGKYNGSEASCPIKTIMDLWMSPKAQRSVYVSVLNMVESLLTMQDEDKAATEEESETVAIPLTINNGPVIDETNFKKTSEPLNYGSKLLWPYVPTILNQLVKTLELKKRLMNTEREVLSRVTELVEDAENSEKLLTLLVPSLLQKATISDEEVIAPLLNTVYNLIKNVPSPGRFVRKLAPLFGTVTGNSTRKLLFSIVVALSKREGSERSLDAQLLDDLNAWDAKWVDQPDYSKRLEAFKRIEEMINSNGISVSLGVIVIHTCFHFIQTEKDSAMKDTANHCLTTLCPALCRQVAKDSQELNFLLNDTIFNLIRKGIASNQNETLRSDCVSLLGCMARECPEIHTVLQNLSLLTNKSDMEVDFFENLVHLQLHRRVRALLKLSAVAEANKTTISTRTLTQFILPLVSHYLLSEKYSNKNTILDSAIKALSTIACLLPWHQYQAILVYYLGKLRKEVQFQKQIVRILTEVLNGFHFDLRQADMTDLQLKEVTTVETESDDKNQELTEEGELDMSPSDEINVVKDVSMSRSEATKVIKLIAVNLLPQLLKSMAQRTTIERHHKLTRKMVGPDRDEEDILRVPLAVAVVKLLQKLPRKEFLEIHLPGILMKLCTFLKSRLESVRRTTRETLQTIMVSLGPEYLSVLVNKMKALLVRGFHVHVLVYSIHSVMVVLKDQFKDGDMDKCLPSLLEICKMDLFGRTSEEKEVHQIVGKVLEARANKSFDLYHILASHVAQGQLVNLILPLKEELAKTMSHKLINKVKECLQQVVLGLTENKFIAPEALLEFSYGTATESIAALSVNSKLKSALPKEEEIEKRRSTDSYIIPPEPKRLKQTEFATCAQTNAHNLVEFGLKLLYFLLKREKLKSKDYRAYLDPVVHLLAGSLDSQYVKITTLALNCLSWLLKMNLPSIEEKFDSITESLFALLHKFAAAGLSKGDNFDLVMAAFKCVAVIVRDTRHKLSDEQIRALLLYCEQDLEDYSRQATAFTLLKALIARKWETPELKELMTKIARIAVTSESDSVRLQARQVTLSYMIDYTLNSEELVGLVGFFLAQLNYSRQAGRESTLEMVKMITSSFPVNNIKELSGVIFVNLTPVLVNDPVPECRQICANIISLLLSRLDHNTRNKLFDVTKVWLEDKKVVHRRLGAQVVGIFVSCEKEDFNKRLDEFLRLMKDQFVQGFDENKPGRFVRAPKMTAENELPNSSLAEKLRDHHLYQVLQALVKVCTLCPSALTDEAHLEPFEVIAENAQNLLAHEHEWVRHAAVQLLGLILTATTPSKLAAAANDSSLESPGYLLNDTRPKLKALALDVVSQLAPSEDVNEKFLMQCMKLLVYVSEVLKEVEVREGDMLSLQWLVRKVRHKINVEITQTPSSTIVRKMAFNWIAALSLKLNRSQLTPLAHNVLAPLARELNLTDCDEALKKVAKEAAGYVKKTLGPDVYNETMAKLSARMEVKKSERKKQRTQLMVTDPERAAKRKIQKQMKKRENKKLKIQMMKSHKHKKRTKRAANAEDFS